jgi:hypothetical protein
LIAFQPRISQGPLEIWNSCILRSKKNMIRSSSTCLFSYVHHRIEIRVEISLELAPDT